MRNLIQRILCGTLCKKCGGVYKKNIRFGIRNSVAKQLPCGSKRIRLGEQLPRSYMTEYSASAVIVVYGYVYAARKDNPQIRNLFSGVIYNFVF